MGLGLHMMAAFNVLKTCPKEAVAQWVVCPGEASQPEQRDRPSQPGSPTCSSSSRCLSHDSRVAQWTFGDFVCRLASGSRSTAFFSSIFFMVVMTLDSYMVITHAHTVARHRTLRSAVARTVSIWTLSSCISLPDVFFTKVTHESDAVARSYEPGRLEAL
ncbi:hypothetical protein KUCAC02_033822 [Chaenocephalus aceratus]|nr:hypothetical protein KUCAC02_033822 [Chaenocephalus aceratus]